MFFPAILLAPIKIQYDVTFIQNQKLDLQRFLSYEPREIQNSDKLFSLSYRNLKFENRTFVCNPYRVFVLI